MSMYDKSKFAFSETFNNSSGKTSGSGFIGVILGLTAVAMLIAGSFGYFFEIPDTLEYLGVGLKVVAAATILLGVRKVGGQVVDGIKKKNGDTSVNPSSQPLFQGKPEDVNKG